MEAENKDPLDMVKKLAETYQGIKFGRGLVGKTSHAMIALFGIWAIVLFRLTTDIWLDIALVGGGCVATGVYVWWVRRTQAFAAENPGLALLEGAEFVEYQKWEAEVKGGRPLPKGPLIPNPHGLPPAGEDAGRQGR